MTEPRNWIRGTGLRALASRWLASTPLGLVPVRVRRGPARGARWTLLPFSANWRTGGEGDLAAGLARLERVEGAVCWDFGAHFGIHTVGMALQVGPAGQVVAFEPDPVAFARLERHVRMNRLDNVRLFRAAASDQEGEGRLVLHQGAGSTFSHFRYQDEPEDPRATTLVVPRVRPDALVSRGEIRSPDLIKVDVQGHGAQALGGSLESIRETRPLVVISLHSRWESEGVRDLLAPLGYSPRELDGSVVEWAQLGTTGALLDPVATKTKRPENSAS